MGARRPVVPLLALTALIALACEPTQHLLLDPATLDGQLVIALVTAGGSPTRSQVILPSDSPPSIGFDPRREELWLLQLSAQALASAHPAYVASRLGQAALLAQAPPPRRTPHAGDPSLIDVAIPHPAILERVEVSAGKLARTAAGAEEATPLLAQVTLLLPVDPHFCRPELSLSVFSPKTSTAAQETYVQIATLDDDRALVLSAVGLTLVTRGRAIERRSGTYVELATVTPSGMSLLPHRFTLSADRPGPRRIVVLGHPADSGPTGIVWEGAVENFALGPVRTATITDFGLRDVTIDARDRTVIVGPEGLVLGQDAPGAPYRRLMSVATDLLPAHGLTGLSRVLSTSDPRFPHLATGVVRIFRGDAFTGTWSGEYFASSLPDGIVVDGVTMVGEELWLAGYRNVLKRSATGDWTNLALSFPPEFKPCLQPMLELPRSVNDVRVIGDRTYVAVSCSALIRIRQSDGDCLGVIKPPSGAVTPLSGELRAISVRGDELLVVGEESQILSLRDPG